MLLPRTSWATVLASAALFATDTITECGNVNFSHGGGKPPHTFTAATMDLTSDGKTSWHNVCKSTNTILELTLVPHFNGERANKVVFFIEDSTKTFSTASQAYPIGARSSANCDARAGASFGWEEQPGSSVAQCDEATVTLDMDANKNREAALPFSVIGAIPSGDVWREQAGDGQKAYRKRFNIEAGNDVMYIVQDANRNQGGSSAWMSVIGRADGAATCVGANTKRGRAKSKGINIAMIAGIACGGGLAVILLAGGGYLFWRRRKPLRKAGLHCTVSIESLIGSNDDTPPGPPPVPFTGGYSDGPPSVLFTGGYFHHSETSSQPSHPSQVVRNKVVRNSRHQDSRGGRENVEPTYRIQDDAGPVNMAPIIGMPPTYNPPWSDSGSTHLLASGSVSAAGSGLGSRSSMEDTSQRDSRDVSEKIGLLRTS